MPICTVLSQPDHDNRIKGGKLDFTKGQLISEQIDAVLNFPKMQRNIARISALASTMGKILKSTGTLSS